MNSQYPAYSHRRIFALALGIAFLCGLALRLPLSPSRPPAPANQANQVTFYGDPKSPISGGVIVPEGRATLYTSGTGPELHDPKAAEGAPERYGDTKTQAESALKAIETQLKAHGLTLKDCVYLRAYLVADKNNNNRADFKGWNTAYKEFFGTPDNPTKVARSSVIVSALAVSDWLIEIEAVAVYPH